MCGDMMGITLGKKEESLGVGKDRLGGSKEVRHRIPKVASCVCISASGRGENF